MFFLFFNNLSKKFYFCKKKMLCLLFFNFSFCAPSHKILFKNKFYALHIFLYFKIKREIFFVDFEKLAFFFFFFNKFSDRQMNVRNYNDCKTVLMTRRRDMRRDIFVAFRDTFASGVQTEYCPTRLHLNPKKPTSPSEKCRYEPCETNVNQDVQRARYTIPYHRVPVDSGR